MREYSNKIGDLLENDRDITSNLLASFILLSRECNG